MSACELRNSIGKLGFGYMRLPMKDGAIDIDQTCRMADEFIGAGFTYFDTAWGYLDGKSEEALRKSVVERYARDRFTVATKFPIWAVERQEDVARIFATQLERTGAGYFDFYLIHAVNSEKMEKLDKYGVWDFIREKKAEGLVRHMGFSFHDTPECLDALLCAHPETEFVQLQINYADWESESVQARRCYEVCVKHDKPVVIMEPVKGGSLATLGEDVRENFRACVPEASTASWAMRFCGSLENLVTVLSGMSNLEQMRDNIATMRDFKPLTADERAAIERAVRLINAVPTIPCTKCKYCVEQCPKAINIPGIFSAMNLYLRYNNLPGAKGGYAEAVGKGAGAADCLKCGTCTSRCPQHIQVMDELARCAQLFEHA